MLPFHGHPEWISLHGLPLGRQFAKDTALNLNAPTKVVDLLPDIIVRCLVVIEIPKLFDLFCDPLHTGELLWACCQLGCGIRSIVVSRSPG